VSCNHAKPVARALRLAELLYLLTLSMSFYFLLMSRTGEAHTIWEVLHPALLPTLFLATTILVVVSLSSEKSAYKMLFIIFHSVLIHSFLSVVFPAGDFSGQQMVLGRIRRLQDEALIHGWPPGSTGSFPSEIFARFGGVNFQGAITVALGQMLNVDILWIHLFLVPVLWGVFTPISVYMTTSMITSNDKVPILASLLISAFPYTTYFGAISVPNSLGFIFFFCSLCFMLRYLSSNGFKTMALLLLFSFFSLFSHYLTGIMSFSLALLAIAFKAYKSEKAESPRVKLSLIFPFIVSTSLLPLSLIYLRFVRPITQTAFTLDKFHELPLQEIVNLTLIGELAYGFDSGTIFLVLVGPALALLCMTYLIFHLKKKPQAKGRTQTHFLITAFLLILVDYRILKLFMEGLPFNEERLWVFRDFLAAPFVAIAIWAAMSRLWTRLGVTSPLTLKLLPRKKSTSTKSHGISGLLLVLNILIPTLLGVWITCSLTASYPKFSPLQTTWYELEAVKSIDETTDEKYVVIGDLWTIYAGERIVGINNPTAYYFAELDKTGLDLFSSMKQDPSPKWMLQAMNMTNTTIAYFILSEPRLGATEFNVAVSKAVQVGFRWRVMGEGKLYIFAYNMEQTPT